MEKAHSDYRIFLDIRGCFFQYIDKKSDLFDSLTDRKFFHFKNSNRANSMSLNKLVPFVPKEEKSPPKVSSFIKKEEKTVNSPNSKVNFFNYRTNLIIQHLKIL
jgi:hypothetical protein